MRSTTHSLFVYCCGHFGYYFSLIFGYQLQVKVQIDDSKSLLGGGGSGGGQSAGGGVYATVGFGKRVGQISIVPLPPPPPLRSNNKDSKERQSVKHTTTCLIAKFVLELHSSLKKQYSHIHNMLLWQHALNIWTQKRSIHSNTQQSTRCSLSILLHPRGTLQLKTILEERISGESANYFKCVLCISIFAQWFLRFSVYYQVNINNK